MSACSSRSSRPSSSSSSDGRGSTPTATVPDPLRRGAAGVCSEVDGAQVAAALLRLGKLQLRSEESLVIEMQDDCRAWEVRQPLQHASDRPEEQSPSKPVVEGDLAVLDCDSGDEAGLPGSLPPAWAPGSAAGRRLMKARAQQCVVCMEDKEHTFVPPHREEESGHLVMGHRFCTDCWTEFLYHSLRQQRRGAPLQPLACPLCRGAIEVPDVWGIDLELPPSWRQALGMDREAPAICPLASTPALLADPLPLWADAAHGPATNAAAAAAAGECSPLQGGMGYQEVQDSPTAACQWWALRCPCLVPTWRTGCFRRLRDVLTGIRVEDPSLTESMRRH